MSEPRDPKGDDESHDVATVRRRIIIGPDGVPRVLDDEELEETTRRIPVKDPRLPTPPGA